MNKIYNDYLQHCSVELQTDIQYSAAKAVQFTTICDYLFEVNKDLELDDFLDAIERFYELFLNKDFRRPQ